MKKQPMKGTLHAAMVRDELLHYVEAAINSIRSRTPTDSQIHSARKMLKRARANLRLLRDAVGKARYARENTALRRAARQFSEVRDAAVLCETANRLMSRVRRGPQRKVLLKVRSALKQARLKARNELHVRDAIKDSIACLHAAMARMHKWTFKQSDMVSLSGGLQRIYRRGRKALAIAREDPTNENLHEWRKQVKYLAQSLVVWKAHGADVVSGHIKRADRLADLLGTDHDLMVFEKRLRHLEQPYGILPVITHNTIDQRQELLDNAFKQGNQLFKVKPRLFIERIFQQVQLDLNS